MSEVRMISDEPAELLAALKGAQQFDIENGNGGKAPVLVLPDGHTMNGVEGLIQAFEKTLDTPRRRRGTYTASDIDSLLRWGARNASPDKPVFASGLETLGNNWKEPKLSLTLIANYSEKVAENLTHKIGWHDFCGVYNFPMSEQWKTWASGDSKPMTQGDFATFIEDRLVDLAAVGDDDSVAHFHTPLLTAYGNEAVASPSRLLELSRGLQVRSNQAIKTAVRLESGEGEVSFADEHTDTAGNKLKVPSLFWLRIPVFMDSEDPMLVPVRLRYRLTDGKLTWSYAIANPQHIVRTEFLEAIEWVRGTTDELKREVLFGTADKP